jgi:hypothetical protein
MKRLIVRIGLGIVIGGLLWGGLLTNPAMAVSVTFSFTGHVDNVGSRLIIPNADPIGPGPILLTGTYTFNSATVNGGDSTFGLYPGTISGLDFQLGTYNGTIGAGAPKFIGVTNNAPIIGDAYLVSSSFTGPVDGGNINGRNPVKFEIDLSGGTTAFSSSELPTTPPSVIPPAFTNPNIFRVVFSGYGPLGDPSVTVLGTLDTLTAVPLPAAVILFGAGLIALVGLGAGSWRKRINSLG